MLLFEDALIVDGERRLPPAQAAGVFHAAEIHQGQFHLEIRLPASSQFVHDVGVHFLLLSRDAGVRENEAMVRPRME